MSIQSTIHMDWKCSKNRNYAKTIYRTSSPVESFAMLHFSHCEKENLVILMMRVRQIKYQRKRHRKKRGNTHSVLLTIQRGERRFHKALTKSFQPQIAVARIKKRSKYESVVRENEAVEGFYLQFLASFYLFLRRIRLIVSVFIYYN